MQKSKSVLSISGSSRSRTRKEFRHPFTTSMPKNWIAPSESVETIEQGKLRAATYAEAYLKQTGNLELPSLKWKEARSV